MISLIINDRIRDRKVEFFNNFTLNLKYDSIGSSFAFSYFFDPDNQEHVELSVPGHFHTAKIDFNGQRLLTGTILSNSTVDDTKKSLINLSGYSLPGIFEDCSIPPDLYPLQSDGLTLREIATKITNRFGIGLVVSSSVASEMDKVIGTTDIKETQKVKQYLSQLTSQRNIILTHDENGNLVFTRANTTGKPILNFDRDKSGIPFLKMTTKYNGQGMHSDITAMKQADKDGGNAGESTVKNPYVPFVFRPLVVTQSSGDDNDTEKVAKMAVSAELKNFTLTIEMDRWEVNGKVIMPNNTIIVKNPKAQIYTATKFFIESVKLSGDQKTEKATLNCVLPEVFNNQTASYIYTDINLH